LWVIKVLQLLSENQWKVKLSKCSFAQTSVHYLGHVISAQGVATDESKISVVHDWPEPHDAKKLLQEIRARVCIHQQTFDRIAQETHAVRLDQ
jgi:hypothetical protein